MINQDFVVVLESISLFKCALIANKIIAIFKELFCIHLDTMLASQNDICRKACLSYV